MKWSSAPLRKVAPPERAKVRFAADEEVWNLQLDQVESQTGRVLKKVYTRACEAGTSTFSFDKEHVLYSKLRPYLNKVVRPDEPGLATTELVPLRPVPEILDPDFLTYFLRSEAFVNFANLTVAGAKMPRMIMDKFWEHHIPLPPPSEQRRIVELLDQADSLRRKRAEADDLAVRILPSLFQKMFGDPLNNDQQFTYFTIADVAEVKAGYAWKSVHFSDSSESGFPVIRIQNLGENTNAQLVHFNGIIVDGFWVEPGEILVSLSGSFKCFRWNGPRALLNQRIVVVRPNSKIEKEYLFTYLTKKLHEIEGRAQGVAVANASMGTVRDMKIPIPNSQKQSEFAQAAKAITETVDAQLKNSYNISTLFQTMLHQAFTGELTAGWREAHMKELLTEMELQSKALGKLEEAA